MFMYRPPQLLCWRVRASPFRRPLQWWVRVSVSAVLNRVRAVPDPEIPPPPSFCEVNVAPSTVRCLSCVPDLYVCPAHLVACGAESFICCSFCLKVLCFHHMYSLCVCWLVVRGCLRCLPLQCLSINLVPR